MREAEVERQSLGKRKIRVTIRAREVKYAPGNLFGVQKFFGSLFLGIPFLIEGAPLPDSGALPTIAALILIPTIGGYYFTSKALSLTEASRVQVIETSDPLFSSVFAFVLFGDSLSGRGLIGAAAIFVGLLLLMVGPRVQDWLTSR